MSHAIWSMPHLNWTNPRACLTQSGPHGDCGLFAVSLDLVRLPHALAPAQVRRVLAARRRRRQGPHRLGYHLGMPRSTIYDAQPPIEGRSVQFDGHGVAFTKTFARRKGVNPVWYLGMTPSGQRCS